MSPAGFPEHDAVIHMVMHFMRQQTSILEGIAAKQDKTENTLADMRERLIRLEVADYAAQVRDAKAHVEKLEARIDKLETEQKERSGAKKLVEWLAQYGWAIVLAIAGFIWVKEGK